jgi:hypothetical protein
MYFMIYLKLQNESGGNAGAIRSPDFGAIGYLLGGFA